MADTDRPSITALYGGRNGRPLRFTDRPRPLKVPPEQDVSWLWGLFAPKAAREAAFGSGDYRVGKHAVRTVRVGDLRAAGFAVADMSLEGIEAAHGELLNWLDELTRHAHLNARTLTAS